MDGWTHFHAYVGNVLKGGTVYETNPSQRNGTPIYQLGNNAQGIGGNWDNGYAAAHIYRDGNWDNVNNGVVWASGARTIPPSFYLTSKPPFFGSNAWPWVDPTTGTRGHAPCQGALRRQHAQRPALNPGLRHPAGIQNEFVTPDFLADVCCELELPFRTNRDRNW